MHLSAWLLAGGAAVPVKVEIKPPGFDVLSALGICDVSDKAASVGAGPHGRAAAGLLARQIEGIWPMAPAKGINPGGEGARGRSRPVLTHSLCHSLPFQLVRSPARSRVSIPLR